MEGRPVSSPPSIAGGSLIYPLGKPNRADIQERLEIGRIYTPLTRPMRPIRHPLPEPWRYLYPSPNSSSAPVKLGGFVYQAASPTSQCRQETVAPKVRNRQLRMRKYRNADVSSVFQVRRGNFSALYLPGRFRIPGGFPYIETPARIGDA